jgi:cyclic beta-1,2-glucan synthetase
VPGVRENGGQYTHAAIWMIMAFAKLGDQARVWELLDMLNPINHGKGEDVMRRYMVEPYVLAADIYAKAPHAGRGGWTWYTGAAGWLYQLITTSFLGLRKEGSQLRFAPCVPADWKAYEMVYRHESTTYTISFVRAGIAESLMVSLDGVVQADASIALVDNGVPHAVRVEIG